MNTEQKKTAVRAGTPATVSNNNITINSILKKSRDVNIMMKRPGELPRATKGQDIPPEYLSKKLRAELMANGLTFVYDTKSKERINISYGCQVYRGTVLVVNRGADRLTKMSDQDKNNATVWLMRHSVGG